MRARVRMIRDGRRGGMRWSWWRICARTSGSHLTLVLLKEQDQPLLLLLLLLLLLMLLLLLLPKPIMLLFFLCRRLRLKID